MKNWLCISLALSVLTNLFLTYRVFDMGVTTTYQSDEIGYKKQTLREVEKLLPLLAPELTKAELLAAASKAGLEVIDKEAEGTYIGRLLFTFSGDKVVGVDLR